MTTSFLEQSDIDFPDLCVHAPMFLSAQPRWGRDRSDLRFRLVPFSIACHAQENMLAPTNLDTKESAQHTQGLNMLAFLFSVLLGDSFDASDTLQGIHKLQRGGRRDDGRCVEIFHLLYFVASSVTSSLDIASASCCEHSSRILGEDAHRALTRLA